MDPTVPRTAFPVKNPLAHSHGWSVELTCSTCRKTARPAVSGWVPRYEMRFGNTPTIYATLHCAHCGSDLKAEAGTKLVELFSPVAIPAENRLLLVLFFTATLLPMVLGVVVMVGIGLNWWSAQTFFWLALLPLFIGPMIFWFNRRVAALKERCACSLPDYEFMGMLGRSYCHRCRNCGNLLRLRD